VRVSDPFERVEVDSRRTLITTITVLAVLVVAAVIFPTQAAVVAVIFALFVMIMLHELGHFVAAKKSGMKVTEFFVGFGPRLWSFTRGETEYGIKGVPLGGYCRIIGMTNLEEVDPADEPRAYRNKPTGPKVIVAAAGPAVHFAIALVLMFLVLFFAGDIRNRALTTSLAQTTQGAQAAGLRPGDKVVAINGTAITGTGESSWVQVQHLINPPDHPAKVGDIVRFDVQRGDQNIQVAVKLQESADGGPKRAIAGVAPKVVIPEMGLVSALTQAPREVASVGWDSVKAIGTMFSPSGISNYFHILSGDTSSNVNQSQRFVSPAGVGALASDAVEAGWVSVFGLLIAINIFVGLFNLLPLLPFDGGHIAIAVYEKIMSTVRRRRVQVDAAKLLPITVAVVAVLGFIFLSSLFLDITHPVANPF
jgi:membrane-associated protease RseP (regulator of RpoE activity)